MGTVEYIAGGAGQNTARVCQWMLQRPGAVSFLGCIGDDAYGRQLRQSANADGVNTAYLVDPETPTGTCAVLIHGKERSLIANLAACNKYKAAHIQTPEISALVAAAKFVYVGGFFVTVPEGPDATALLLKAALEGGKKVATNLSAPFICQFFSDPQSKVLAVADYVFGNESEAEAWATKAGLEDKSPLSAAKAIAALPKQGSGPRTVVITQGSSNVIVVVGETEYNFPVPKLDKNLILDTNGAGDAFAGGFLSQIVSGQNLETAVAAGNYAARCILQVSGCTLTGVPNFVAPVAEAAAAVAAP
jgi:adenosine kinase